MTVNGVDLAPSTETGYGEGAGLWAAPVPPGDVEIVAQGLVETEDRAGLVTGLTVRLAPDIFCRVTPYTKADRAIRELLPAPGEGERLAWLHQLRQTVHDRLRYVSGVTDTSTTAIEALNGGVGVCQDQTHLFVAAARAHGVPARYVTGYLLAKDEGHPLHETHAWAEAWVEGLGWVGFDPSANLCPTARYVRLTTGLDARDAAPVRGHAFGGSASGVDADVRIALAQPGDEQLVQVGRMRAAQDTRRPRRNGDAAQPSQVMMGSESPAPSPGRGQQEQQQQ